MSVNVKASGTGYALATTGDVNHAGIFEPDVSSVGVPRICAYKVGRLIFVVVHGNPSKPLTRGSWYEISTDSCLAPQTGFLQDLWYNGHHCQLEITAGKYRFRTFAYDMTADDFFSDTFMYMSSNADNV